jgi:ABC-type transport system involved in cytochrome c biogenesis permease subunit
LGYYAKRVLKALASLQLTVVLFALAIGLVFFGTLAQIDNGIWTVVDKYFWSWYVNVPFDLFNKFLSVFWEEWFPSGKHWPGHFPFPAGKLLGGLMLVNLLAAHALRFRLTWKRSGVLLIHSGLLLMFAGEFVTREFAVEQRMTIDEGQSVDYTEDTRNVELAIIDTSDPKTDRVAVIPQSLLKKPGTRITHPDLPVDVEVLDYMANASLVENKDGKANPATAGNGRGFLLKKEDEVSGVDPNQKIDLPAAYVKLYKKGTQEAIGVYAVALRIYLMGGQDDFDLDGKKHNLVMRFTRYYKPFRIHLDKFRFDRYVGTTKPKNFSSDIRVFNSNGELVREQRIAMNEPLRYAGETFYQSSFDDRTEKTTILQVVKNPGWILPYASCVIVTFGLMLHFLIYLIQFLTRLKAGETTTTTNNFVRLFPWLMLAFAALYLVSVVGRMTPKRERDPYNFAALGQIPVAEGGRVKPLDTVARVKLRIISHREYFVDEKGDSQPAIKWYLDVISAKSLLESSPAWKHKVFRIENDQVLRELKLEPRDGLRYSLDEMRPHMDKLLDKVRIADQKRKKKQQLDKAEVKMLELAERLSMVESLTKMQGLDSRGENTLLLLPPTAPGEDWQSLGSYRETGLRGAIMAGATDIHRALNEDKNRLINLKPDEVRKLVRAISRQDIDKIPAEQRGEAIVDAVKAMRMDPTGLPEALRQTWMEAGLELLSESEEKAIRTRIRTQFQSYMDAVPAAGAWERIIKAYQDESPTEFNAAVADYRANQLTHVPDVNPTTNLLSRVCYAVFNAIGRNRVEVTFNRFAPFFQCIGLYVLVGLLAIVGFTQQAANRPEWGTALRKSATLVLILTFGLHLFSLLARMYLMDRPLVFVTNLYSSAIFIGLGCVALGLALEWIYPIGIGNVLAAKLGLATCIVAHNLGTQDTLEMMEAVLDTNFWLATHVTTVTLGYTATFVAGFIGAFYVIQMLASVIRDSFLSKGEPSVGSLLAFGTATTGIVAIPLFFLWFLTNALDKFEVAHPILLWGIYYLLLAAGVMYVMGLMLMRISTGGVDSHGQPIAGQIPTVAKPIVSLALTPERSKVFGQMVYGVVCFATLLSFVGTVLGGIWADQSWGRFWGWDPKENGAVLIVLWNSLILHARWAGLVKDRGVAVLAIFGNVITAWSWFGTNQLGVGLHAYGFDKRLADGCYNFWLCQMLILTLGLVPKQFWSSATRKVATTEAATNTTNSTNANTANANSANTANTDNNGHQPSANGTHAQNGQPHTAKRDKRKPGKRR